MALLLLLTATAIGCSLRIYRSPDAVGVVQRVEAAEPTSHLFLADGRKFELNNTTNSSQGYVGILGVPAAAGELFFAGSTPSPWYGAAQFTKGLQAEYPGCYWITASGTETNDALEFDAGVRLLKAETFRDEDQVRNGPGKGFSSTVRVDESAHVLAILARGISDRGLTGSEARTTTAQVRTAWIQRAGRSVGQSGDSA